MGIVVSRSMSERKCDQSSLKSFANNISRREYEANASALAKVRAMEFK